MEWYYVWWPWLTSKRVAQVYQHQLSFLFVLAYTPHTRPHTHLHRHRDKVIALIRASVLRRRRGLKCAIQHASFSYLPSCYRCSSYLSAQPDLCSAPRTTRSSSVVTVSQPRTSSSLRITNRSFRYASRHLWNQFPVLFRQPCTKHPADDVTLSNSPPTCSPVHPPSHIHCFIPGSKLTFSTNLFHHIWC